MMHRKNRRSQWGLTLPETALVLAVGMLLLVLGLRMIVSFQTEASVRQIKMTADQIFQSMTVYYRANCYGTYDPNTIPPADPVVPGTLNPASNPATRFPINIVTDLFNKGILPSGLATVLPNNTLLDTSSIGTMGYVAQFNMAPMVSRSVCTVPTDPNVGATGPLPSQGCATSVVVGTVVSWQSQVAVRLANVATASAYLKLLGGDCLSSLDAGGTFVTPCEDGPIPGQYVVWERTPSASTPDSTSSNWILNPQLVLFQQFYSTYPLSYMVTASPPGVTPAGTQYYLCGS